MASSISNNALVYRALPNESAMRMVGYVLLAFAGSLLIALAAQIKVPFYPVPATLQTLAIFAISAAYGRNLAVATLLLYLAQGALGLPVFATGSGLAYMAGPTGGYLAGFLIAAFIIGSAADRGWSNNAFKLFAAMLVAEVVILGLGYLHLVNLFGAEKAMAYGVGLFIVTDLIKAVLASAIVPAVAALINRK
ncbi:MAG: biotin transporter BioY [Ahrensia sp.]|nr:biotin transporter BioY [Ahrensia sp.]